MSIGIGFIGVGNHGRHHLREFSRLLGAHLIAVFDTEQERAQQAARDFPPVRAVRTLEDLLSDLDIRAVVIATPAETHAALTIAALESGRDVLLEKPLADTPESARRILEASAAHPDAVLMVGHCERFNSAYVDARKAVADGRIGIPRFGWASRLSPLHLNDPAWPLGTLDTAVHDIDLLLWLIPDRPVAVSAQGTTVHPELTIADQVTYQIFFESGALAQGHIGWVPFSGSYPLAGNAHPRLFLAGTDGTLSVDLWQRPDAVHTHSTGSYFWPDDVLVGYGDSFTEVTAQDYAFLQAVSARTPAPVPALAAYDALRVAHAAHVSLTARRGAVVPLETE